MKKIAIIKLGALGDVVRTLPVVEAIKKLNPASEIHWFTKKEAVELIQGCGYIDKIFAIPCNLEEKYFCLYNLDIDAEAFQLASQINAEKKYGFYSEAGYPAAFNVGAEYYLNTLFDDELKKTNKKTYQEMMFEAAEIPYEKEIYKLALTKQEIEFGSKFLAENSLIGKKIIGIHVGASSRWPSKAWHKSNVKEFIVKAKKLGNEIILFGGPNEIKKHKRLVKEINSAGIKIFRNNPKNILREFVSIVNLCDYFICADSLALHIALGLNKPTVGLFFCTSPDEVESYGLLKKIVSPMLYDFFPEKMDKYDEKLVKSITAEEVLSALGA